MRNKQMVGVKNAHHLNLEVVRMQKEQKEVKEMTGKLVDVEKEWNDRFNKEQLVVRFEDPDFESVMLPPFSPDPRDLTYGKYYKTKQKVKHGDKRDFYDFAYEKGEPYLFEEVKEPIHEAAPARTNRDAELTRIIDRRLALQYAVETLKAPNTIVLPDEVIKLAKKYIEFLEEREAKP